MGGWSSQPQTSLNPQNSPFLPRISHFVFPNLSKTRGGWVSSHIWESFPKKKHVFLRPSFIQSYPIQVSFFMHKYKGTSFIRKTFSFGLCPNYLSLSPPPPNLGKLYNFFWTSKTTFLRVLQNQVTMITTMM